MNSPSPKYFLIRMLSSQVVLHARARLLFYCSYLTWVYYKDSHLKKLWQNVVSIFKSNFPMQYLV